MSLTTEKELAFYDTLARNRSNADSSEAITLLMQQMELLLIDLSDVNLELQKAKETIGKCGNERAEINKRIIGMTAAINLLKKEKME